MSDDKLTFLEETEATETETEAEAPQVDDDVQEAEAPEPEQAETVEAEAETGETTEGPPTSTEKEGKQAVPVMALLDEREKRQAAERKAEETARELAAIQARMREAEQPLEKPDYYGNPEAAIQQHIAAVKLQQSKFLAERDFGADTVAEAYAYFDNHPQESQQLLNHPSPFHAAVEVYKQKQLLQEIGSDPDAWKAKQLEELKTQILAEQPEPSKPTAPPPSMAKSPRAGGEGRAPGNNFDELFS